MLRGKVRATRTLHSTAATNGACMLNTAGMGGFVAIKYDAKTIDNSALDIARRVDAALIHETSILSKATAVVRRRDRERGTNPA